MTGALIVRAPGGGQTYGLLSNKIGLQGPRLSGTRPTSSAPLLSEDSLQTHNRPTCRRLPDQLMPNPMLGPAHTRWCQRVGDEVVQTPGLVRRAGSGRHGR